MSPLVVFVLGAVVLPLVLAFVLALFARGDEDRGRVVAPLALGAAFLVTHAWTQDGLPEWPAVGAIMMLFYFGLAMTVVGALVGLARPVGLMASLAVAAASFWIVFEFHRKSQEWESSQAVLATAAFAFGVVALVGLLDRGPDALPRLGGLLLIAVTSAVAGCLALGSTVSLAQIAGGLAAGGGGLFLAGLLRGELRFSAGQNVVWVLANAMLLFSGMWLAELGVWPAVLCFLALAAIGPGVWATAKSDSNLAKVLGWSVPLMLALAALVVAWIEKPAPTDYGGYY